MDEKERQKQMQKASVELQKIATDNDVLVLSFIAPDKSVKVSPVGVAYASLDIDDLYEIEKVIESLEEEGPLPKNLHLIIQTPGGFAHVATKIAKYLRSSFDNITAYVPYEASSGGTVLCLAANRVVMGRMANLTPIDPQVMYKGQRVSAASYQQAVNDLRRSFGKMTPDEIPPPYQQLAEKLDPVILQEMNKRYQDAMLVAAELLDLSYKPKDEAEIDKVIQIAKSLAFSPRPHSHLIEKEEAESLGINIDETDECKKLLKIYKNWVSLVLGEEKASHVIHHFKPKKAKSTRKASDGQEAEPSTEAK